MLHVVAAIFPLPNQNVKMNTYVLFKKTIIITKKGIAALNVLLFKK